MRLKGKSAIVTGAGQGFGLGIAETFAREGARVACLDFNADLAKAAAAKIGAGAIALTCDVSKKRSGRCGGEGRRSPPSAASIPSSTMPAPPIAIAR